MGAADAVDGIRRAAQMCWLYPGDKMSGRRVQMEDLLLDEIGINFEICQLFSGQPAEDNAAVVLLGETMPNFV